MLPVCCIDENHAFDAGTSICVITFRISASGSRIYLSKDRVLLCRIAADAQRVGICSDFSVALRIAETSEGWQKEESAGDW